MNQKNEQDGKGSNDRLS